MENLKPSHEIQPINTELPPIPKTPNSNYELPNIISQSEVHIELPVQDIPEPPKPRRIRIDENGKWDREVKKRRKKMLVPPRVAFPPAKRQETTFQEHILWLKEKQAKLERLSKTSEYASINIDSKQPVGIVLSSDWHLGSESTDYDTFEKHMNMIKDEPNAYLVALSNTIDGYIWPGGIWSEVAHIPEQIEMAKQFAKEWKEKLLAVVGSRCHDWTKDRGGVSPQEIAFIDNVDSGMPFFTHGGLLTINLNGLKYDIGMMHKARFHSSLNPTNANRQIQSLKWPQADVIAIAHHHVAQVLNTSTGEGPYKKDVTWVRTGTYKINDGYSKDEGFGPGQIGGTMIILDPKEKHITSMFRIEDGMQYLKLLKQLPQYQ